MLGAAVAFWIAGFDFFYALFDEEIDRREGLHSIVTRFGVRGAFLGARLAHVATDRAASSRSGSACRSASSTGSASPSSRLLLAYEHSLVRPGDLRRLDTAFFTMNGVISVVFAAFVILDAVTNVSEMIHGAPCARRPWIGPFSSALRPVRRRAPRDPSG